MNVSQRIVTLLFRVLIFLHRTGENGFPFFRFSRFSVLLSYDYFSAADFRSTFQYRLSQLLKSNPLTNPLLFALLTHAHSQPLPLPPTSSSSFYITAVQLHNGTQWYNGSSLQWIGRDTFFTSSADERPTIDRPINTLIEVLP